MRESSFGDKPRLLSPAGCMQFCCFRRFFSSSTSVLTLLWLHQLPTVHSLLSNESISFCERFRQMLVLVEWIQVLRGHSPGRCGSTHTGLTKLKQQQDKSNTNTIHHQQQWQTITPPKARSPSTLTITSWTPTRRSRYRHPIWKTAPISPPRS